MSDCFVNLSEQPQITLTEWLWKDRIPFGGITILEGEPGTNKSTLAYDLTASLTTGRQIQGNSESIDGGVILLQGEDSFARISESLGARECDLRRVSVVNRSSPFLLPGAMKELRKAVVAVDAKLIVIDPVDEFFDKSLANDDVARRAITPLAALAQDKNLAIVLVRHMTKTGSVKVLNRGRGSIRMIAAARSALLVAGDPTNGNRRILAQRKCNLGPLAPSLSFEIRDQNGCPMIEWLGTSSLSEEDLIQPAGPQFGPALGEAIDWLVRVLAHGPMPTRQAKQLLLDAGVSKKTSWRAKQCLGIATDADGCGPNTVYYWRLPDSQLVRQLRDKLNLSEEADSADPESDERVERQAA